MSYNVICELGVPNHIYYKMRHIMRNENHKKLKTVLLNALKLHAESIDDLTKNTIGEDYYLDNSEYYGFLLGGHLHLYKTMIHILNYAKKNNIPRDSKMYSVAEYVLECHCEDGCILLKEATESAAFKAGRFATKQDTLHNDFIRVVIAGCPELYDLENKDYLALNQRK